MYEIVKHLPAAHFYYKGSHSHPVRRTVLVIESKRNYFRGYELREGVKTRKLYHAPVKTYRRDRIAKLSELGANKHRLPGPSVSTLRRMNLIELLKLGI